MDLISNHPEASEPRVLVVGASGRMTAAMLSRIGFKCAVADLYGDVDTYDICEGRVTRLENLNDLHLQPELFDESEFVVFAGGLEAKIDLAKLVSKKKRAFAAHTALRRTNNYQLINKTLAQSNLERAFFHRDPDNVMLPAIAKVLGGSGRSQFIKTKEACHDAIRNGYVLQNWITGQSESLIFVSTIETVRLIGGSVQLNDSLCWTGSISGTSATAQEKATCLEFARSVVEQTGLQGVFGVDFIKNEDGFWPIDINPRIPASAEVVGDHVLAEHMLSFGVAPPELPSECSTSIHGKLVVFNDTGAPVRFERNLIAPFQFRHKTAVCEDSVSDVPADGEMIQPGHPVLTVFCAGESHSEVESNLRQKSNEIIGRLRSESA